MTADGGGPADCEAWTDESDGLACSTCLHGPPDDVGGDLRGPVRAGENDDADATVIGDERFGDMILLGVVVGTGRAWGLDAWVSAMMLRRSTLY